jgi:hypothetical protein
MPRPSKNRCCTGLSVEAHVWRSVMNVGVDVQVGLLAALEHLELMGDRGQAAVTRGLPKDVPAPSPQSV